MLLSGYVLAQHRQGLYLYLLHSLACSAEYLVGLLRNGGDNLGIFKVGGSGNIEDHIPYSGLVYHC